MTIKQVADELGVSTKTLRRWEEAGYFVPHRDPHTDIRLYHPVKVQYWKKYLSLNRRYNEHLKKHRPIIKEINKHLAKPLSGQEELPLLDTEAFSEADKKLNEWGKEHKKLLIEVLSLPKEVKKAILQMEQEEK